MLNKRFIVQAFKYGIVGVINTALTFVVYWILFNIFHTDYGFANASGFVAGFLNSYVLNRAWTFKSNQKWLKEFTLFFLAFAVCWSIQYLFVAYLRNHTDRSHIVILHIFTLARDTFNTILGMIVYTSINFFINKYLTFKPK